MARTKQTARRSTGGPAPRSFGRESNTTSATNLFASNNTRSISVVGEVELEVEPDLVKLSFRVSETAADTQTALDGVLSKVGKAREVAKKSGVPNNNVCADSVSIKEFLIDNDDDEDDEESVGGKDKKKKKVKNVEVTIILRIRLEGPSVASFNNLMIDMMELHLQSHNPPVYDVSTLTDHRQSARKAAVQNAKAKAQLILSSLDDPTVSLGPPIVIEDIQVDNEDDATDGFSFSHSYSSPLLTSRGFGGSMRPASPVDDAPPPLKKARLEELQRVAGELFVIPKIRVISHVKTVFEILAEEDFEEENDDPAAAL